jgi:hypothetical protein
MPSGPDKSTVEAVLTRAGHSCEACGASVGDRRGIDFSIHHRRPRGMGGTSWFGSNLTSNLMVLCGSGTTGCHGDVESHRIAAITRGFLVTGRNDPAEVPVTIRGQYMLLTNGGGYA